MNEILAMLSAKTVNFKPTGGRGELTPQMVAAACAGLPPYEWSFVMCALGLDVDCAASLRATAFDRAKDVSERYGWHVSKREPPDILRKLSDMALDSALKNKLCVACCGTKLNTHMRQCGACSGTGFNAPPSQASRARDTGVTIESWNRRWKKRFAVLETDYDIMWAHASSHIRRKLRGEDDY